MRPDKLAFPFADLSEGGLTVRQYYAGLALAALVSAPSDQVTINGKTDGINNADLANCAVGLADALIAELSKK